MSLCLLETLNVNLPPFNCSSLCSCFCCFTNLRKLLLTIQLSLFFVSLSFVSSPGAFTDIDECPHACGSNSLCVNNPGSYSCSCKPGFLGDPYFSAGCTGMKSYFWTIFFIPLFPSHSLILISSLRIIFHWSRWSLFFSLLFLSLFFTLSSSSRSLMHNCREWVSERASERDSVFNCRCKVRVNQFAGSRVREKENERRLEEKKKLQVKRDSADTPIEPDEANEAHFRNSIVFSCSDYVFIDSLIHLYVFSASPCARCFFTDENECLAPNACGVKAECYNTVGSYQCVCPPGHTGDPYTGCIGM